MAGVIPLKLFVSPEPQQGVPLPYGALGTILRSTGPNSNIVWGDGSQTVGTQTNDNANAGNIGEFISSSVVQASAIGLSNGISANVTSISLTAGDWNVWGNVLFHPAVTTSITISQGGISTTSGILPAGPAALVIQATPAQVPAFDIGFSVGQTRFSLAVTTIVYLVVQSNFTVSTNAGYGFIGARRTR